VTLIQFLKINYVYQWQTSVHMIYIMCHVLIYIIYYLQTGEIVAFLEYTKIIRSESESFDRTRKSNIMIKNRKFYFHIFMQYTNVFISSRTNYKTDMKYEIHILKIRIKIALFFYRIVTTMYAVSTPRDLSNNVEAKIKSLCRYEQQSWQINMLNISI